MSELRHSRPDPRLFPYTLPALREQYRATWGRTWPHDDDLLAEFWQQALAAFQNDPVARYDHALKLMREGDPAPTPLPPGSTVPPPAIADAGRDAGRTALGRRAAVVH